MLLAHLIIKGVTLKDGYAMIRQNRPKARPNVGFWEELCKLEQHLLKTSSFPLNDYIGEHEDVNVCDKGSEDTC